VWSIRPLLLTVCSRRNYTNYNDFGYLFSHMSLYGEIFHSPSRSRLAIMVRRPALAITPPTTQHKSQTTDGEEEEKNPNCNLLNHRSWSELSFLFGLSGAMNILTRLVCEPHSLLSQGDYEARKRN
jgi:hypothetical protein